MNIVVIGSSNTDMIINVPHIPAPGETVLGGTFTTAPGGKGANQAVAAARAGGKVTLVARVGQDMFGDQAIRGFEQDGINVSHVIRDKNAPSGVAEIFVAADGENSIAVASGANANLSSADVESARDAIINANVLVMQLETPLDSVLAAAKLAHEHKVWVVLNPAPAQELPDELYGYISVLTPNEHEAELLTGIKVTDEKSAAEAGAVLREKGVRMVMITLGARGVYIYAEAWQGWVRGFDIDAVDTTAAGDVFTGALAVALADKQMLGEAVQFAQAAAALSVTRAGAQPSCPTKDEIVRFMQGK